MERDYSHLTPEHLERIREQTVNQIMQDIEQEPSYGRGIVEQYVEGLDLDGQLDALSQDRDMLYLYLDFDPETGEDWKTECDKCGVNDREPGSRFCVDCEDEDGE